MSFNPVTLHFPRPSSLSTAFQPINKRFKKYNRAPRYRSKNGELWGPPKGWIKFYRCEACYQIMSKKEATKCPQRINICGHITCAKCIVTSYLVELNPNCPVKGCNKCIDPSYKTPVEPITPPSTPINEIEESSEDNTYNENVRPHYCGDADCEWDCGVLWCGCIDVCRGRCGLKDDRW